MAHNQGFAINEKPYRLFTEDRLNGDRRSYSESMRKAQPDEGGLAFKSWKLSGPIGPSRQLSFGENLGPDYSIDLDGRNEGLLTSVAKAVAITLAGDVTPATADPDLHVAVGNWTETNPGGTDADASNELNSYDSPDDTTYWETADGTDDELIVGVPAQTDPGVDEGMVVRARVTRPAGDTAAANVKLRLYEDATTIIATSGDIEVSPVLDVALLDAWVQGVDTGPVISISAGSNRLLVVTVAADHNASEATLDLTGMTYGDKAMTKYSGAVGLNGTGSRYAQVWYLDEADIAAATGSTITPTWDTAPSHGAVYHAGVLSNVNQTTPISDDASAIDAQTLTFTPLVVQDGDYVLAVAVSGWSSPESWEPTAGYTEVYDGQPATTDGNFHLQTKLITADATETVTATFAVDHSRAAGLAVVVQGATSGSANTQNISFNVAEQAAAAIASYADLRIAIIATSLSGSDVIRVTEMQLGLNQAAAVGDVITIDEQDGQVFISRGDETAQVNPGDMTEVGSPQAHGQQIVDTVASWRGVGYVSFGAAKLVQKRTVVTASGSTYGDVTGVYSASMAAGPDRIWTVEAEVGDQYLGQLEFAVGDLTDGNLSNGIPVGDANSGNITGIYTLGELMVAGTLRGPRSFTDAGAPSILGEATADFPSIINGSSGGSLWGWHYHGSKLGLFALDPDRKIENPVGPGEGDEGRRFEGPIDGYPIAVKPFKGELWCAYLTTDGDTYILRGLFNPNVTPGSGRPDWYVFRKLTAAHCHAIGFTTGRAVPAVIWAEDGNAKYSDLGFRGREIADANYRHGTDGGTWFGQTMVMPVGLTGNVRWAKFFVENASSLNTWQLALSVDEGEYVDIDGAVTTNGAITVRPVDSLTPLNTVHFSTLKPRFTQVAASETNPPQIRGDLTIAYDERPEFVREINAVIEANGEDLALLQALVSDDQKIPVKLRLPTQTDVNVVKWGYLLEAEWADQENPADNAVRVKLIEWELS